MYYDPTSSRMYPLAKCLWMDMRLLFRANENLMRDKNDFRTPVHSVIYHECTDLVGILGTIDLMVISRVTLDSHRGVTCGEYEVVCPSGIIALQLLPFQHNSPNAWFVRPELIMVAKVSPD